MDSRWLLAKAHANVWVPSRTDSELESQLVRAEIVRVSDEERLSVVRKLNKLVSVRKLFSIRTAIFQKFYKVTWPCTWEGFRVLPLGRQQDVEAIFHLYKDEFDKQWGRFLDEYASVIERMADGWKWPSRHVVASKYSFRPEFMPIPADGKWHEWFSGLREIFIEEIKSSVHEALVQAAAKVATRKLNKNSFNEIFRIVAKAADLGGLPADVERTLREAEAFAENARAMAADANESTAARAALTRRAQELLSKFGQNAASTGIAALSAVLEG